MKLRCTVVYDYELPDDPEFLHENYGTAAPGTIAAINHDHNEAVDMICTLDQLEAEGAEGVCQVVYKIEPVTLEDEILGPVDG